MTGRDGSAIIDSTCRCRAAAVINLQHPAGKLVDLPSVRHPAGTPPESVKTPDVVLLNRELSQLAFNRRVLAMADDPDVPLLERLRFLCILASNLD